MACAVLVGCRRAHGDEIRAETGRDCFGEFPHDIFGNGERQDQCCEVFCDAAGRHLGQRVELFADRAVEAGFCETASEDRVRNGDPRRHREGFLQQEQIVSFAADAAEGLAAV